MFRVAMPMTKPATIGPKTRYCTLIFRNCLLNSWAQFLLASRRSSMRLVMNWAFKVPQLQPATNRSPTPSIFRMVGMSTDPCAGFSPGGAKPAGDFCRIAKACWLSAPTATTAST